ncbi:hypothetical protein LV79_006137 [Actinokineospora globicatena]|nr:hypothetical protein [Actinokineospora globicatena]
MILHCGHFLGCSAAERSPGPRLAHRAGSLAAVLAPTCGFSGSAAPISPLLGDRSYPHVDLHGGRFKIDCRGVPVDWTRAAPRRGWGPGTRFSRARGRSAGPGRVVGCGAFWQVRAGCGQGIGIAGPSGQLGRSRLISSTQPTRLTRTSGTTYPSQQSSPPRPPKQTPPPSWACLGEQASPSHLPGWVCPSQQTCPPRLPIRTHPLGRPCPTQQAGPLHLPSQTCPSQRTSPPHPPGRARQPSAPRSSTPMEVAR